MRYTYKTAGTCAAQIDFELDGNVIKNVVFHSGCHGNLQAISRLVEGLTVEEAEERMRGIRCGMRSTSCADQLARALRKATDEN